MTRRFMFLAPVLLAGAACHADPAATDAYARLNDRLIAAKSLTGSMDLVQSGSKYTLTFRFLRPNYSSISMDGYESHGDGKTEWSYMPNTHQYESRPAGKEISAGPPLIGFEAFMQGKSPVDYTVDSASEATFAEKHCRKIVLASKDDPAQKFRLYVDPEEDMPVGWLLEMKGPDPKTPPETVSATYRDVRLDVPMDPKEFAWAPPKGTKKYDMYAGLLKVGTRAPIFTLKTPEGAPISLASVLKRNRATLVNFWSYG